MKDTYRQVALILLIVGGINWGFVGLFNVNIISGILGVLLGRLVYVFVGVAAGYMCYEYYVTRFKKPTL